MWIYILKTLKFIVSSHVLSFNKFIIMKLVYCLSEWICQININQLIRIVLHLFAIKT